MSTVPPLCHIKCFLAMFPGDRNRAAGLILKATACLAGWSLFLTACAPLPANYGTDAAVVELTDRTYTPAIKSARIIPDAGPPQDQLEPAVARLGEEVLALQFDVLSEAKANTSYYARLVHCNYDWTQSTLRNLDYLGDFNEFPITDLTYSFDTQIPYVHYRLPLPVVKLPGNYVVAVYRGGNPDDVVLTLRFSIYADRTVFRRGDNLVGAGTLAQRNQQINFTIGYPYLELQNPMQSVFIVLRQNKRWDNLVQGIKPSFVREDRHELEYQFFDVGGGILNGWNEFRFFDLRSIANPGQYVDRVDRGSVPPQAFLQPDVSRDEVPYSQVKDINGGYVIANLDQPGGIMSENYVAVHWSLRAPVPVRGNVYVMGAFNYWKKDQGNRMTYDSANRTYRAATLLKQGWYNYMYVADGESVTPNFFEGGHFETENFYEVFTYYRSPREPADLLIGYFAFTENPR